MEQTNVKIKDTKIFSRLMKFAGPVKKAFLVSVILMILSVGMSTVMPLVNSAFLEELGKGEIEINKLLKLKTINQI